jgi:hypothetical protein
MKRAFFLVLCGVFVCALVLAGGGKEKPAAPKTAPQTQAAPSKPAAEQPKPAAQPQPETPAPRPEPEPPAPPPKPANPYFDGEGGKGITLAVLEPTGKSIAADEQYMLPLVQGSLTGDFAKYSAMTIIDRQNLDKILAEQTQSASGNYSDEDYIQIGALVNARYILTGSITKTPTTYMLELAVSDAESGVRKASYPPKPVSPLALQNLSAVKEASAELLAQLGVQLTDKSKQELSATVNTAAVEAETALSKAITAQKNGTVVEALSYYYQAVNIDASLTEAASRLNVLQADVSSGNIGDDTRNDIKWRRDWLARLTEAEQYYANYTKESEPYYLLYSTNLQRGKIDYEKETVPISFHIILQPNTAWFDTIGKVVNLVRDGLQKTNRASEWGLDWPRKSVLQTSPFQSRAEQVAITAELVNDEGTIIGSQNIALRGGWELGLSYGLQLIPRNDWQQAVFSSVNANLITDKLTIRIASINGVNADTEAKNKRISIMTEDEYCNLPYNGTEFEITRQGTITKYLGTAKNIIIPSNINGIRVTSIGESAFEEKGLTNIIISNGVLSIEKLAFYGYSNRLTSITIPNSVTSIESGAFSGDGNGNPTSVTISSDVTFIERGAFGHYNGFDEFYNSNGKKAGTYTRNGNSWTYTK